VLKGDAMVLETLMSLGNQKRFKKKDYMGLIHIKYKLVNFSNWIVLDIPNFFRNIWIFRKELISHSPWDYAHSLKFLKQSLIQSASYFETRGMEIEETRLKKIYYIKRCIYLIDCIINDDFSDMAEKQLSINHSKNVFEFQEVIVDGNKYYSMIDLRSDDEKDQDNKIMIHSKKIEKEVWIELFDILRGDIFEYDYMTDPKFKNKSYQEIKTGRGLMNWWD
jgi:hypothetical protein